MKKLLLMMAVGGIVVLSSCSKTDDYTCSCEYMYADLDGVIVDADTNIYEFEDQKEEDAEDLCEGYEFSVYPGGNGVAYYNYTETNVCTLN